MIESVQKRNGTVVPFNRENIQVAVNNAVLSTTNEEDLELAKKVADRVSRKLSQDYKQQVPTVDEIHVLVENKLMDMKLYDIAREYISYRDRNKPDIFRKRVNIKPYEYPHLIEYGKAIQHSYWLFSEFNYTSDIQDIKVNLTEQERMVMIRAMLAISNIENHLKTYWAKVHDHIPKPEVGKVGAIFSESECFDDQTEILTENGFKPFYQLLSNEKVGQYDQETKEINFVVPNDYIEKSFDGYMHHYSSTRTDMMVTSNHELLLMRPAHNHYTKKKSGDGTWGGNYRYPISGYKSNGSKEFTELDRLLIAIQADGCLYGCCPSGDGRRDFVISVSKDRKLERIEEILNNCDIKFKKSFRNSGCTVYNARLPENAPNVHDIKNFDYIKLDEIDHNYVESFLDELSYWDSCKNRKGSLTYYNTNERAIDKISAIAVLGGYKAKKAINYTAEESLNTALPDGSKKKSSKTVYVLFLRKVDKHMMPYRKEVYYNGTVYCVSVPKENIITRRNGMISITGNCRHEDAYSNLIELLGLNNEFEKILEVPAIQKRVAYLQKANEYKDSSDPREYFESIILFSTFVENISLFSQFLIIMSFNKHKNYLKGMSNVVESTALEELNHSNFGFELIDIIKHENPHWWNESIIERVKSACMQAYEAEMEIIDWIYEYGDIEVAPKRLTQEYIKYRFNKSMKSLGIDPLFEVDDNLIDQTDWFEDEITTTKNVDFFNKRSNAYSKRTQSVTEDDLF